MLRSYRPNPPALKIAENVLKQIDKDAADSQKSDTEREKFKKDTLLLLKVLSVANKEVRITAARGEYLADYTDMGVMEACRDLMLMDFKAPAPVKLEDLKEKMPSAIDLLVGNEEFAVRFAKIFIHKMAEARSSYPSVPSRARNRVYTTELKILSDNFQNLVKTFDRFAGKDSTTDPYTATLRTEK